MKLLLASASPRRKELLSTLVPFDTVPSGFSEVETGAAREIVLRNARGKAEEVFARFPDCVVLGADTAVALGDRIFGKPADEKEAEQMLSFLSGKTHSVYTGVCLLGQYGKIERVVETKVLFKKLSKKTIQNYIKSGSPLDKAGAYGIQDNVAVASFEGSYSNVVGLPLEAVEKMLKQYAEEHEVTYD